METAVNRIGTMQGRLSPPLDGKIQAFPRSSWVREFALAQEAQLESIEWIYDVAGEGENPLTTPEGVSRMRRLSERHGVRVRSLCADYFMERSFLRVTENVRRQRVQELKRLLERCHEAGIQRLVLPFVDNAEIRTDEEFAVAIQVLEEILPEAQRRSVAIHVEASLPPDRFRELFQRVNHSLLRANYDIGNSASLGYNAQEELEAYGAWIGSVHVKDRVRGGSSVPLGKGDADFALCFSALKRLGYKGDYILQVARGPEGDEVSWARENREFVLSFLK